MTIEKYIKIEPIDGGARITTNAPKVWAIICRLTRKDPSQTSDDIADNGIDLTNAQIEEMYDSVMSLGDEDLDDMDMFEAILYCLALYLNQPQGTHTYVISESLEICPYHVKVWDAINDLVMASGGSNTVSSARMDAVVRVEEAIRLWADNRESTK